jgi:hypothetical protein
VADERRGWPCELRRPQGYRDGSRAGWFKVKDRSWYEREARRFER